MKERSAEEWEELARREPYFAVLAHDHSPGVAGGAIGTAAFFESGEQDVAALLDAIASLLGREVALTSVLDFGCGAGRLLLPLAQRAGRVVGCDIAPTMLAHARANAERAGLHNVAFLNATELGRSRDSFDFIAALLVLEHIPASAGYGVIRTLLSLLAPGGVAALHVPFERAGGGVRRLMGATRKRTQFAPRPTGTAAQSVYVEQPNGYDKRVLLRDIAAADARLVGQFPMHQSETPGAVLIVEKSARATSAARP